MREKRLYPFLADWFRDHKTTPVFIRLRGYSRGNTDYRRAKQPVEQDWTHAAKALSDDEIAGHTQQGGWIGLIVPMGYIVVDVDRIDHYQHLLQNLLAYGSKSIAITTPGGGQFLFKDTGRVKTQGVRIITAGGMLVDYRLAGKGQIVMPTGNTEGRYIEHMDEDIGEMPLSFLPVRAFKKGKDEDSLLPVPITEGQRDDTLFRHAGRLREWNAKHELKLGRNEIISVMQEVNHLLCDPPMDDRTVQDKVKSALSYPTASKTTEQIRNAPDYPYFVDENGYLCRWKEKSGTQTSVRLANFNAKIVEEITEDNGLDRTHYFMIEGDTKGRTLARAKVSAKEFPSMAWTFKEWGNQAILEAGQNTKDLVRHAIQVQSHSAERKTVFTHTGWRDVDNQWVYLTGSGAVGNESILVALPEALQRYHLPLTVDKEKEFDAIRTSLAFLEIGNSDLTVPLYALLWLSALTTLLSPMPNFSGYAYGDTGTFKTTVGILLLSHFGDFSSASNLSNFDDTANAIEKRGFVLKDTLTVLDDYHPSAQRKDSQNKEQLAQRLLRAYSNRTARDRLNSDTTSKGRYTPRGMLLVTGEELVQLQSTLARVLVLEFRKGDIDQRKMTVLQRNAELLPHAMTSFLHWLREHMADARDAFPDEFKKLREMASIEGTHKKLPEQTAFLQFAMQIMVSWAVDTGALREAEGQRLLKESWNIFTRLSERQSQRISDDEPVKRFFDILNALITQGLVRINDRNHSSIQAEGGSCSLIGYQDDIFYYLLPVPLWHEVQRYCSVEQSHFPLGKITLYKRLADNGIIQKDDKGRNTIVMRIGNESQRVLKIMKSLVVA